MHPRFSRGILCLFLLSGAAHAAENLSVAAQVDKKEVRPGERLTFSVTIAGSLKETPKVHLSSFDGFQVLATGQSQQIQILDGRMQQSLTLTYTLAPVSPGTHTLGPVKVEYGAQVYETQPVEVTVAGAPAGPEPESEPQPEPAHPELKGGVIL